MQVRSLIRIDTLETLVRWSLVGLLAGAALWAAFDGGRHIG